MMFLVIYFDEFLDYKIGKYYLESLECLIVIVNVLKQVVFVEKIRWIEFILVLENLFVMLFLVKVYSLGYVNKVREIVIIGGGYLDGDILVLFCSYDVVLLVVSVWLNGIDIVLEIVNLVFVLVCLLGYYVEGDVGMGFCLFFNVVIVVYYVLEQLGIKCVVIIDWDVYYGNGIQVIVEINF